MGLKEPTARAFKKEADKAFKPELKESPMLDNDVHVTVFYVSNPEMNAKDLLTEFWTKSKAISTAKIHSTRQPITAQIAQWGVDFISKMQQTADTHNPKVDNYKTPLMAQENLTAATKK